MEILGARSFEMGNGMLNTVDRAGATVAASTTEKHTGSYSLVVQIGGGGGAWARWAVAGTPSNPSVSVWLYLKGSFNNTGTGVTNCNIRWLLSTGEYVELRWNGTTHTFDAYVDGAPVAAGTIEISVNTWFHLQFYSVIADAGSIDVLIDGHSSIAYSGDTQPGVAAGATYLYAYMSGNLSNYDYLDDLVWGSGGLLGDWSVYEKRPSSDVTAEFTPSSGSDNYALEDETPQNDGGYNYADTDGKIDEFGLSALDITGFDVGAVIAWSRAREQTASGDSIDVGIDSGGTDSVKRSTLSATWEYYFGNVHETDPDTGAAWNQAGLDAVLHRKVAVIV